MLAAGNNLQPFVAGRGDINCASHGARIAASDRRTNYMVRFSIIVYSNHRVNIARIAIAFGRAIVDVHPNIKSLPVRSADLLGPLAVIHGKHRRKIMTGHLAGVERSRERV